MWSEVREGSWGYDSHYIKFIPSTTTWGDYKNVTDNETYGGDEPDLTFSSGRVHVSFIKYDFDEPKTRDKVSGTWNSSQSVPFHLFPLTTNLRKGKPIIANNWLNEIYRADYSSIGTSGSYIGHSYRNITGSTWTKNEGILYSEIGKIHVVDVTNNEKIQIIYYDNVSSNYLHKTITGTSISSSIATIPLYEQSSILKANSNDLYLLRIDNPSVPGKIKFRHYDDAPLAPKNLAVNKSGNNHPLLSWTANTEPDISIYKIYKLDSYGGGWQYVNQTTSTSYEDTDYSYCTAVPPAQCADERYIQYRINVTDAGSNVSDFSNTVGTKLVGGPPSKIGGDDPSSEIPFEYSLSQNYPNPFNPSTTINYSVKSAGMVSLKVYDMLGNEVSNLINEFREPGNYSAIFNATNLPSGMYVYKLTAVDFVSTKKLILVK